VIGEVALSIVLLIGAGLLMSSFFILTHADLGFDPQNVLYFRLALPKGYNTDVDVTREKKNALTGQILERMQSLPGVTAVSESMLEPPLRYDWSDTIIRETSHRTLGSSVRSLQCGIFQDTRVPLLRGRLFSEDDENAKRHVMVVNESFSRQYFPTRTLSATKSSWRSSTALSWMHPMTPTSNRWHCPRLQDTRRRWQVVAGISGNFHPL